MTHPAMEFLRQITADDARKISLKQRQTEEAAITASLNGESDFLRPKWDEYKPTSLVSLWDATCLSVNITPKHKCAHPEWIQRNGENFVDVASIAVKQLLERYELASYRASVPGGDLAVLGESKTVELQHYSAWALSNNIELSDAFPIASIPTPKTGSAKGVTQAPGLKQPAQEARILELLIAAGFDPLNLPVVKRGKLTAKSPIKKQAIKERLLFSSGSFDDAWQRLRDDGRLIEKNS